MHRPRVSENVIVNSPLITLNARRVMPGVRLLKFSEAVMGYDLHITRAEGWPQSEQNPITLEEWLAIVEEDPELTPWDAYTNSHFALWSGDSEHEYPWMNWSRGKIYSKNPDGPLIRKMVSIAERLNAKVIGQEGEVYDGREDGIDFDSIFKRND